jgi:acyl phosphate:glycerol-3-phosphate acyltransferase
VPIGTVDGGMIGVLDAALERNAAWVDRTASCSTIRAMESGQLMSLVLAALWGYLCGSVPFGLILTRLFGLGDIRQIGSGNIGATNVLRTGRKGIAAATLILDAAKGTLAVLVAGALGGDAAAAIAGLAAFLGHVAPLWLGFRGGKGVATFIGVLLGLSWPAGLVFAGVWLGMAALFRISSLSALTAAVLATGTAAMLAPAPAAIAVLIMATAIFFTHRANIERLRHGTEPRIRLSA